MERLKRRLSSQNRQPFPRETKKNKADVHTYSYDLFLTVLSNLSEDQKVVLQDIGFSSLLHLSCSEVPLDIFYWLVDHFDFDTRTLKLENGFNFTLNSKCVEKILGIPAGGIQIRKKGTFESYQIIKYQIPSQGQTPSVTELVSLITPELSEFQFARVFMLLALSSFLCPNTRGVCSCRYYPAIINVTAIRELDWCSFVLDWLLSSIKKYQEKTTKKPGGIIGGCALLLVICYLEFLNTSELTLPNHLPRLAVWSTRAIKTFTLLDSYSNGSEIKFGRLQVKHLCCTPFNDCFLHKSCSATLPDDIQNFVNDNLNYAYEVLSHYSDLFHKLEQSVSPNYLPHVLECVHNVIRSLCSELSTRIHRDICYLEDTDSDSDASLDIKLQRMVKPRSSKVDPVSEEKMKMLSKYFPILPTPSIDDQDLCPDAFLLRMANKVYIQPAEASSDFPSNLENVPNNYEELLFPSSESIEDVNKYMCRNDLLDYLYSLLQESQIVKQKIPEKREDTGFIDRLIQSLENTTRKSNANYIVEEPVDDINQIAPLNIPQDLTTNKTSLYGLSLNERLSLQTNLPQQPKFHGAFPSFDILGHALEDDPQDKECTEPDSLVKGLCKEFKKCSEMLSEENRNRANPKTDMRQVQTNTQVIFVSAIENRLFRFLTSSISNSPISPKIFEYKGSCVDQRKLSLSMMSGGWIHFHVMDCFLKMFACFQESVCPFQGQIFQQFIEHSTAEIMMQPLLDHSKYKPEFLEIVGFNIDKAGYVHIPCYITKQWLLVVVNFIHKRFDVLTSEFNTDQLKSTIYSVIYNFRVFFTRNFPDCSLYNIRGFCVRYVHVPKHKFRYDSGIFVLQFIQTFNGTSVKDFSNADLIPLRARFLFQLLTFEHNESKSCIVHNFFNNNATMSDMCPAQK